VEWLSALARLVLAWYGAHELLGMFLFIGVEEAGIPLFFPGDLLLVAAGARGGGNADAVAVCLVAAAATSVGSSVLYAVARQLGRPLLRRYGRCLHLSEDRIERVGCAFRRHGAIAIVVGRVVPGMRTPTTVMAGLFGVPYRTFAPATTGAGVLWALIYFYAGAALAGSWHDLGDAALAHPAVPLALAAAGLASLLVARRIRRRAPDPLPETPLQA
jgi:membrane protein DedA with SNARE-associated domain